LQTDAHYPACYLQIIRDSRGEIEGKSIAYQATQFHFAHAGMDIAKQAWNTMIEFLAMHVKSVNELV
jgi:hypothetical protein